MSLHFAVSLFSFYSVPTFYVVFMYLERSFSMWNFSFSFVVIDQLSYLLFFFIKFSSFLTTFASSRFPRVYRSPKLSSPPFSFRALLHLWFSVLIVPSSLYPLCANKRTVCQVLIYFVSDKNKNETQTQAHMYELYIYFTQTRTHTTVHTHVLACISFSSYRFLV